MPATRYIPILRWKQGERTALNHLSSAGKVNVAPLLVITLDQFRDAKPTKARKTLLTAADVLAKQILDCWGTEPIFIDASDLQGTSARHALDDIAAAGRALGLKLIPATTRVAGAVYDAAVLRMATSDGRGAGLRVPLNDMISASAWVASWLLPPSQTDLIVDLANSVGTVSALGASVSAAFATLHATSSWRSVTVAGSCMPLTLTGFAVGRTYLNRVELAFWRTLSASGLPYQLDFGDYGTVAPNAPSISIPAPVPINAKYTLPTQFAIFHGVKIKGPGAIAMEIQLRSYAQAIVTDPNRGALSHCWGDAEIDRIAATASGPAGSPGSWVGISMNRHIEITRHHLP